jgi:oxygen-independent coproporphyrinogen-3 oxidase
MKPRKAEHATETGEGKDSGVNAVGGMAGGAQKPPWGSLTGIRPAKLATAALEAGAGEKAAARTLERLYHVSPERSAMCIDAARASLDVKRSLRPDDIALYVGIPFCPTRCAYCSFVSNSVEKSFKLTEPFTQVLLGEIKAMARTVSDLGLRIIAVYIGGGTPTALSDGQLEAVMAGLKESFDLSAAREYTVEAGRPDTLTPAKLDIMLRYGAGRVCVNPQSLSPTVLKAIGRVHTPEDALEAARLVRRSGATLSMDIIAGLPSDTPQGFAATLEAVLALKPENVTVHTLSLKKGSRVMLEGTEIPSGEDVAEMLGTAARRLRGGGYKPYYLYRQKYISGGFENTGWSLPGSEGLYNVCMMEEHCTVMGLGGGGVTKLVLPNGRIERIFNAKYPKEYIETPEKLTTKFDRINEYLRTN